MQRADFGEIDCAGVQDLSSASGVKIRAKAEAVKAAVMTRSVDVSTLDTTGIDTYNQVLCIQLEDSGKENVLAAIDELMARDDVVYAGPDYVLTLCSTEPDDEYYDHEDNWAPDVIDLPEAWEITTGSSEVVVGVIDTGIDGNHEDLAGRVPLGLSWDFTVGDNVNVIPSDSVGHGTHVAGIIGSIGNNGIGGAGVCHNITLASLRITDANGVGYSSWVANAIVYAETINIRILNFSGGWGTVTGDYFHTYYNYALETVIEQYDGLFICSAGNGRMDIDRGDFYHFPAEYILDNLISVGNSTSLDERYYDSNWGATTVDIFAPGAGILSCFPAAFCREGNCEDTSMHPLSECISIGYHKMSGTSMSAPYVTGVAALLLSIHPELTPAELKEAIVNTADISAALAGKCVSNGRINVYRAIHYPSIHNYEYLSRYNIQKHKISCSCGCWYLETHTWNATHTRCLTCGFSSDDFGLMYMLDLMQD